MKYILLLIIFNFQFSIINSLSAQNQAKVDKYVAKGETWLSDRLQMHWRTHATQQYMKGEAYDHCGGDSAAYPTLQINGARSHVTSYKRPALEELEPQQEDARGMYLLPNGSTKKEWASIKQTGNIIGSINLEICGIALDAAKLWKKTNDERYAKVACNVLTTYMLGVLNTKMPYDMNHGHMQTLYGLQTHEVIHEDCIAKLTEMYSILRDGKYSPVLAQEDNIEAAFKHWADIIEANGVPHNNWDLMQARFIFNVGQILKHDKDYADGKGQEHYFQIVETGRSIRQWSLKTLTEFGYMPAYKGNYPESKVSEDKTYKSTSPWGRTGGAIWCECPGYSQVVLGDLAEFVRLYKTQLNKDLTQQLPVIVSAAKTDVEYLYPDSMTIGFGDTHPSRIKMDIYQKLNLDFSTLHPSRTFTAPGTSWLIQRTGMNKDKSFAFAINGSDGNHMHANGISLELFGRGLRLAPDGGIGYGLYSGDDYKEYYSQFPAHNTVCVDGVSNYPVMKSNHPIDIVCNKEIKLKNGTCVQYAIVNFTEPETMSEQQRVVAMVSKADDNGDGYFVDVFRSHHSAASKTKTNDSGEFHDYFYHNLGQQMHIYNNKELQMEPTQELAFAGGHIGAYSYLFDKKKATTAENLLINYSINNDSIVMQQYAKGEKDRTVYQCLAPTTEGLSRLADMPYNMREQATLTYVARQQGEAWTRPFVNVFVPSSAEQNSTIDTVEYPAVTILNKSCKSASAVLVRHIDNRTELIVTTDSDKAQVKVNGKVYNGMFNAVAL